jgi:hypothetical protein
MASAPASKDEEEPKYPEGLALGLIMGAVWICFFLVALVSFRYSISGKLWLDPMLKTI